MNFAYWLDQTLGPPWSGLVMLGLVGSLSAFSAYVAVQTIRYVFRDESVSAREPPWYLSLWWTVNGRCSLCGGPVPRDSIVCTDHFKDPET
jgi:hypothetical protein